MEKDNIEKPYLYVGYATYMGMSDKEAGLKHGAEYFIKARQLSRGLVRVKIESDIYYLKIKALNFTANEFPNKFRLNRKG